MHQKNEVKFPKMLSIVLIFLAILLFIPNITLYRIVEIGSFRESLAIFFFPMVYSIADAITEKYGQKNAIFVLLSSYIISLFFSTLLMISCYFPFPQDFKNPEIYAAIFKKGPYVILVGLVSVGISMLVNINLMSSLKLKMRNKHFMIRSIISSSVGELIVTVLAYPLLFLRFDKYIYFLMLNAYVFKVAYSILAAFPAKMLVFLLRYVDGDERTPFSAEFKSISQSLGQKEEGASLS